MPRPRQAVLTQAVCFILDSSVEIENGKLTRRSLEQEAKEALRKEAGRPHWPPGR
jgi:hypothetical protein